MLKLKRLMKKIIFILVFLLSIANQSIAQSKGEVGVDESMTAQRKKWLELYKSNYPTIFQKSVSVNPNLFFLFTYLPISEIIAHNEAFFIKQIEIANNTRNKMPWGKTIPDLIFKNYVLNPLVFNETLDTIRIYDYNSLKDRVNGLSVENAVLEVGYWCREQVVALPWASQMGNSISSLNAQEVSFLDAAIFQVAALRSIGIPARLGYVPALSHTDGELYFIEVWINEKWVLVSPNEPRELLDQSWTKAIIGRSMIAYTRVIGNDQLNENTEIKTPFYQIQNIQKQYCNQVKIIITVVDSLDKPLPDVPLSLMLVKNATLFPFITKITNEQGQCSFYTNYGSLIAFSAKGENLGFEMINTNQSINYTLKLVNHYTRIRNYLFNLYPPAEKYIANQTTPFSKEEIKKIAICDSIRNNKMQNQSISVFANNKFKFEAKDSIFISNSRLNNLQIATFIKNGKSNYYFNDFIEELSIKVLCSSNSNTLSQLLPKNNNIKSEKDFYSENNYKKFILNPQIVDEQLTPWREYFDKKYPVLQKQTIKDLKFLIVHVKNNITLIPDAENYSRNPISPIDVDKLKIADLYSRDLYFIALCRTFGIPAQWSSNFKKPVIYDGSEWRIVCIDEGDLCVENYGSTLALIQEKIPFSTPIYGLNYSLSKYDSDELHRYDIVSIKKPSDSPREFKLENGLFAVTTTTRTPSSVAYANLNFYHAKKNIIHGALYYRNTNESRENYGRFDSLNSPLINLNPPIKLTELTQPYGVVIVYINPCEYASLSAAFDIITDLKFYQEWKGSVLFYYPENMSTIMQQYVQKKASQNIYFIEDKDNKMLENLTSTIHFDFSSYLPAFFVVNQQNEIVYFTNTFKNHIVDEFYRIFREYELFSKTVNNGTLPIFNKH